MRIEFSVSRGDTAADDLVRIRCEPGIIECSPAYARRIARHLNEYADSADPNVAITKIPLALVFPED